MRLLIAGWHGLVARALIEAAPSRQEIKALAAGRPALDVRDPRSIERAFGDLSPDMVINSAAYTAVDKAEHDQEAVFALNREGAALLARAAARRNIPVIHLSTHYVFDGEKPTAYEEDDTPSPATVYGRSKYEGECAVADANPRHVIIRTGWVFSTAANGFAARMLAQAQSGKPLRVVADQRGNPTYAPHLAAAILDIACRLAANPPEAGPWGTYHAAGTGETTWHGLASELLARAPRTGAAPNLEAIASSEYPALAPRPVNAALKCDKFERTFALRLPPWQYGVTECVKAVGSP
ncbi:dTDP-4-dehydrorhamnose reductase [Hyphomicrobium sp.]|uniref:dTDP-4-dehydrorhamnose reductase n=1 Tax=Hyphomicrobium sp. TaxID=82 RepID=UPI003F71C30B